MGAKMMTQAQGRLQGRAMLEIEDYEEARRVWRQSLTDDEIRSFVNDYYQHGVEGDDIDDALKEFRLRFPRGRRVASFGRAPTNKLPRCAEHADSPLRPTKTCPDCIALREGESSSSSGSPVNESMSDSSPIAHESPDELPN